MNGEAEEDRKKSRGEGRGAAFLRDPGGIKEDAGEEERKQNRVSTSREARAIRDIGRELSRIL